MENVNVTSEVKRYVSGLKDNEDVYIREMGKLYEERVKNEITHDELENSQLLLLFEFGVIDGFASKNIPLIPTVCEHYEQLSKKQRQTCDTEIYKEQYDNWKKACYNTWQENVSNMHWLKVFLNAAKRINDMVKVLHIEQMIAEYTDNYK